jgi:Arc/MetJ family transcription regulator
MKTTINIPDSELREAMRHARTTQKNKAVLTALEDFNRRHRLRKLVDRLGQSDNFMSLDELLKMRELELKE